MGQSSMSEMSMELFKTRMCVLCMEHEKSVVLLPCKHMCMCKGCTEKYIAQGGFNKATCPMCRERIVNTIEPYT